MSSSNSSWQRFTLRVFALGLLLVLYSFARLPSVSRDERARLAAGFRFSHLELPMLEGFPAKTIREVHPSYRHVAGWISTVGAAVALADLDGDGLANDLCTVDSRIDQVVIEPVPGQEPQRFAPFALDPAPAAYDPATMAPMGCVPGDLNEDGEQDLLVYYWGRPPIAFLRRQLETARPLDALAYRVIEIGDSSERWYTNAATRADLDGDGHADLVIGNYFPDGSRVLDANASGREQMHSSMSRGYNGGSKRFLLFVGASAGPEPTLELREVDVDLPQEARTAWTLAVGAADLDGDLLPEIYFGNDFGPDRLLHNRSRPGELRFAIAEGRRTLLTPRSKVLGHDSFKGMGIDFGDVNGDGWLDLYVSNIAAEYALEESHFLYVSTGEPERLAQGVAPYADRSEPLGVSRSGWGWDTRLADFNNDGVLEALQATGFLKGEVKRWPELHEIAMGNDGMLSNPAHWHRFAAGDDLSGRDPNPFFVRAKSGRFVDLAHELGLDQPHVTRGIATADVDSDGDLDFAIGNQWQSSFFYRNENPTSARALVLALELPAPRGAAGSALPAIGAQATVELPDGRRLVAQVDGGNGHSGKRSPQLHFGLGALPAEAKVPVTVRWRDGAGVVQSRDFELASGSHRILLGG